MTRVSNLRRYLAAVLLGLLTFAVALAQGDRKFTTDKTLATEARTFVQLLERYHYNRDAVRSEDYAAVVPDYMAELDPQHLFFLNSDKTAFSEKYAKNLYYNTSLLGNLDAAYEIYYVYDTRIKDRINWIFEELKKDYDFAVNETYRADRTKSEWPSSVAAADDLWRKRLKFDLVGEMLNKKSAEEAKTIVRKRYDRWLKLNAETDGGNLAEAYLSTIAHLYDPHTTYFSADTFEDFGIQMKLKLVGIGALLGVDDDVCSVKEIVPGGPADLGRALKPADKILAVAQGGGEPVEILGMKLRKIVDMIRGDKGTQVRLIVQPADATDPSTRKEIVITRDTVKLNSARARAAVFQVPGLESKQLSVGVITLPAFYSDNDEGDTDSDKSSASKDVATLIGQLKQNGIQGLVLDLRHNGGGYLTEAIDLAGLFIPQGPIVQVKDSNGETHVDNDENTQVAYTGPLAVLVDRFSASASEIVTGALQNYGRAVVIGDSSTHGKGSVQTVVEMKSLLSRELARATGPKGGAPVKTGAAKITIQKYYLPSGASTQNRGVVPDIVLPSIDDYISGIGEASLPHALVWDQIRTSFFDGAPLDAKVLTPLRQGSIERQSKLDEFAYLRENIEWFKTRQEQKLISVNLEERKKQKDDDDAFRKQMKAEKEVLAKSDYPFKEFRLGPPRPPRIKPVKKEDDKDAEDDPSLDAEENDTYVKADVHLRETLRVVSDAIALGRNKELWASNRPPLTSATGG
jgi:carboxyl-terminal processing protease